MIKKLLIKLGIIKLDVNIPKRGEKITNAAQIKAIIEPIPEEKFITCIYGDYQGNSCFLGHIHRALDPTEDNFYGDGDGYGARQLTRKFLEEKYGLSSSDGTSVNNYKGVNGYNEDTPKKRVMHLLKDMIKAGY